VLSNISLSDALLSCCLAFVGGYGDAASFILAKSFTGRVTGNLVLGAIAIAAHQWRTALQHLSAIVTFVMGNLRECDDRAATCFEIRQRPLSEIASLVGFSDQSHLGRHFRRITGLSPNAMRRAQT
jgi:uncharacterized membrane protein YoaK (UPF0700 family)